MDINQVRQLAQPDMQKVDAIIQQRLASEVVLINQLGHYIINSGGKRVRPIITTLCARALGYQGEQHNLVAAIIEFIHTATLLHDDVVDASDMRRGRDTANALWGNEAAVLVGDFLYSRSFEMMVDVGQMRVMEILSQATRIIAEGEVLQLMNCHDPDTTESKYMDVIHFKTAKLFEAAAQLSAVLTHQGPEVENAMCRYGMHLGTAFQLIDDVMDYTSDSATMGKNAGDDLAEGKPTLPLIHAMTHGNDEQKALIRQAIEQGGLDHIDAIMSAIRETGALDYTSAKAREEADAAIAALDIIPDSPYKQALISLANFSAQRNH